MASVLRRLSFVLTPTPTLEALGVLHAGAQGRGRVSPLLDPKLTRAVERSLEAQAAPFAAHERLVRWLIDHEMVRVEPRAPLWRTKVTGRVDLVALGRTFSADRKGTRGYTLVYAVRALLQLTQTSPLWMCTSLSSGAREVTLTEAMRALEALGRAHGVTDWSKVPKRFEEVSSRVQDEPAPKVKAKTEKVREAPPKTETASEPAPKAETKTKAKARARKKPTESVGFGGLPDDAESTAPPVEPPVAKSARGLTFDAEFFLESAGLKAWPCPRPALLAARRQVIGRLHPDHAGDASARDFHRALKGFGELVVLLDAAPSKPVEAAPPAPSQPTRNEWPPPPPPKPAPTTTSTASKKRAPRAAAPKAETAPKPPPPPPRPLGQEESYFLHETGVAWPCDATTLHNAWQRFAARLRRITPASAAATLYTKAHQGYDQLSRQIAV